MGGLEGRSERVGWRAREKAPARRQAAAPAPNPWAARLFGWLAGLGMLVTLALLVPVEKLSVLTASGGVLTALGRATGLAGAYLMLIALLLIARIPAVESALGQDKLVGMHRRLGPWVLGLVVAHVWFVTLGYAQQLRSGFVHELVAMITTFPTMLPAAVGFGLLVLAGVTSYRYVRAKMRYETWWAVHLYTYLAVALSLPHQILTGAPFIGNPAARAWWISLWAMTAGTVLVYRWGLPLVRSLRHKLTVEAVEAETPGVVSVVMRGRHLDRLPVSGGQYLQWRFLKRGMWWQAHPYSLSELPTASRMRITVKRLGDHSEALAQLTPGRAWPSKVPMEPSPTRHATTTACSWWPPASAPPRCAPCWTTCPGTWTWSPSCAAGPSTIWCCARRSHYWWASAAAGSTKWSARARKHLDAPALRDMVPDIAERDLFVCGPSGFMKALVADARSLGVPTGRSTTKTSRSRATRSDWSTRRRHHEAFHHHHRCHGGRSGSHPEL